MFHTDLSQLPITKIFWSLLAFEAVAFFFLLILAFRSESSSPEGLVGAWLLVIPPLIWAVLAWLFQRTESPAMRLAYTAVLAFPLVVAAVGPIYKQVQRAVWERGWRGADYFPHSAQRDLAGAIYDRNVELVKKLIPGAGDLNKPYLQETTLFDYAMSNTDASDASFEIIRALLAAGANPNVPPGRPLTLALSRSVRFAQLLVDAGADVNAKEGSGRPVWWTVLSASEDYDKKLAKLHLLLDRGADLTTRDHEGGPVAWAAYNKAWRAMWLLMERGADWKGEQEFGLSVHQMLMNELQYRGEDLPEEFRKALAKYEAKANDQP